MAKSENGANYFWDIDGGDQRNPQPGTLVFKMLSTLCGGAGVKKGLFYPCAGVFEANPSGPPPSTWWWGPELYIVYD